MPGRPKRMAAKLAELEERAFQLSADLRKLRPYQYTQRDDGEDTYSGQWNVAVRAVEIAAKEVDYLLGLAEERAYGEGTAEEMDAERDRRRGLWPLPSAADEGAEKAEKAGA